MQLNLEEIPRHLFIIRWRKDPSDNILVKMYKTFYNSAQELNRQNENVEDNLYEDYNYLLNRTWYKVQQIVKAKPETARNFYILFDKSVKEELSLYSPEKTSQNNEKIKNPAVLKSKGIYIITNISLLILEFFIH